MRNATKQKSSAIFYGFQYPHHGANAGFSALAKEMAKHCRVVEFSHPSKYAKYLGKLRMGWAAEWFSPKWFEWNEARVMSKVDKDTLIHYFFPEDSLRTGHSSLKGLRRALTCHQPLSAMLQMKNSKHNPQFFEGLKNADLVFLMSDGEISAYREFLPHAEVCCIRHGVDTDFFSPGTKDCIDGPLRILTVGSWLRDYAMWAKTANLLVESGHDVEFTVIANKNNIKAASEHCKSDVKVQWHCGISDEELALSYRNADILFLPLHDAWANNAMLEAMSSGLPVVCTDLPATREYLGPNGVYVPKDAEVCVEELIRLHSQVERKKNIACALRERACNHFSWPVIAQQHVDAYNKFLSTKD
jgi:glycosyltransferase involved in cell wall biosynthesis